MYNLVDSRNYGALKGEMIRDRLVVGIRDSYLLSESLQLDANLTLKKAKTLIRQKEVVHEEQGILKGDSKSNPITLNAMKVAHKAVPPVQIPDNKPTKPTAEKQTHKHCGRCGRGSHKQEQCPAKDTTCHKCHHKGHFSAKCFTRPFFTMMTEEMTEEAYIDWVTSDSPPAWKVAVIVGTHLTIFRFNTVAEVNAFTEQFFLTLGKPLQNPSKLLYRLHHRSLDAMDQFEEI